MDAQRPQDLYIGKLGGYEQCSLQIVAADDLVPVSGHEIGNRYIHQQRCIASDKVGLETIKVPSEVVLCCRMRKLRKNKRVIGA